MASITTATGYRFPGFPVAIGCVREFVARNRKPIETANRRFPVYRCMSCMRRVE